MSKSGLQPLKKGNLSEQVYTSIRNALMEGRYEPGERLTISGLANELGVSITPVREAIFRLVSDRVLEMKAATAIHVPQIDPAQLTEIQTIRHLLEGEAAAAATIRSTPALLQDLEAIQENFQRSASSDPHMAASYNRQFHFALIEAAQMPMLAATVENMWVLMGPLLRVYHQETPKRVMISSDHGHFVVLRGLREKDPEKVRQAIQEDIRLGLNMIDWIEQRALESAL